MAYNGNVYCPVCGKVHADTTACIETTVTRKAFVVEQRPYPVEQHKARIRTEINRVEKTLASIRSAITSLHDAEYENEVRLRKLVKALKKLEPSANENERSDG